MAGPHLGDLPTEVLHQILTGLNLRAQCHLRLVNRFLQWKVTDASFRDRFRSKTLDMTRDSLEAFITITKPGRLGCLIQRLTICGMAIDYTNLSKIVKTGTRLRRQICGLIDMTCEDSLAPWERVKFERDLQNLVLLRKENDRLFASDDAIELLVKVFKNIKDNSVGKGLIELSTQVVCIRDDPFARLSPERYLDISHIWDASAKLYQVLSK